MNKLINNLQDRAIIVSLPGDPHRPPLPAIVLAAGASSRMGHSKALLPIQPDRTFVGRILRTLTDAALAPLVVVVRERLDLDAAWGDARSLATWQVINPDPARGQLSSLVCGLQALAADAPPAVLMTLVDVPLPRVDTVTTLVDAWRRTRAPLVRLVHDGRHGHPVIFSGPLLTALCAADPAYGAKPILRAFADRAVDVAVSDPGVIRDVDTPDEYRRLLDQVSADGAGDGTPGRSTT